MIYGFQRCVQHLVDQRASDLAFLQDLSHQFRPAIIFDAKGVIAPNLGAAQLIHSLEVSQPEGTRRLTALVSFIEYLDAAPSLECLDSVCGIETGRASLNDWIFAIEPIPMVAAIQTELPLPSRFRPEIVR